MKVWVIQQMEHQAKSCLVCKSHFYVHSRRNYTNNNLWAE